MFYMYSRLLWQTVININKYCFFSPFFSFYLRELCSTNSRINYLTTRQYNVAFNAWLKRSPQVYIHTTPNILFIFITQYFSPSFYYYSYLANIRVGITYNNLLSYVCVLDKRQRQFVICCNNLFVCLVSLSFTYTSQILSSLWKPGNFRFRCNFDWIGQVCTWLISGYTTFTVKKEYKLVLIYC